MSENDQMLFKSEGEPAFPEENKENDNSPASSPEKNETDQPGSSDQDKDKTQTDNDGGEDDKNFANHPRWMERENDWKDRFNKQEERHTQEITKLREDLDKAIMGISSKEANDGKPVQIPSWFGGDEEQWQAYQNDLNDRINKVKEDAKKEALGEISAKSDAEQKKIEDATKFFQEQVAAIESDKTINPDGLKVDQNKLLKFVLDNDLVDSQGRWNYRAGFQMMRAGVKSAEAEKNQEKKKIAGATMSENRAETKQPTVATSEDFADPKNRPW